MWDHHRLLRAYQIARQDLLAHRAPEGHWVGLLSSSALSTATAVSALSISQRNATDSAIREGSSQLIAAGTDWLLRCQNADGGWGDTDKSRSNIATTMLVEAAVRLAGKTLSAEAALARATAYVAEQGGIEGLFRRYGADRTFAAPILMNCALAGMAPWEQAPRLPFELACLPFPLLRFLRLPVVSYALPALVAVGQAVHFHRRCLNPLVRLVRRLARKRSLIVVARMQPASGGFLEAIPLTSFVVMGLVSVGQGQHPIVRRGVSFLFETARPDGGWPIDTNLATWNTTLAVNALGSASGEVGALACLGWLLDCQHQRRHPFTQAAAGGWGWNDQSGAVPDVDDTSGALLALSVFSRSGTEASWQRIEAAARQGVEWLLGLQNRDGGWPTFCRGWGTLPFDRSAPDLTAHALRALHAWKHLFPSRRIEGAIARGLEYLAHQQRPDGSWLPLWFGNENWPGELNPVYGTSRVLLAYRDLGLMAAPAARRGVQWLVAHQGADGGWGGPPDQEGESSKGLSSVEETAVAVEALLSSADDPAVRPALAAGVGWLVEAVESGRHRETAPIGLYFAKLWYYERVYPLVFTVAALGSAVQRYASESP